MKKVLKGLLAVIGIIVVVLIAALVAHPLWVGPLVGAVAEKVGPKYTGTPIALTNCVVNLYSGHLELAGFDLANPPGCSEASAASVSSLKVDFDTLSALKDVVVVRSVDVSGIFASYVKGASGKFNFTEIGDNAKAATGSSEPAPKAEAQQPKVEQPKAEKKAEKKSEGKKVIIERLSIGDIRVAAMGVRIPLLPGTIVLKDIGKKTNGATAEEAATQVQTQVMEASGAAGKQLSALIGLGAEYGKKGLELGQKGYDAGKAGLENALDAAKKLDVDGAKKALQNTGDSLKDVGKGLKGLFGK